jgi:mannose-6-phosphate isomerase-like protein (cupin superfamily)
VIDLLKTAAALPNAWSSVALARVGDAAVKVLRMADMPVQEESHSRDEVLLVVEGVMPFLVGGESVTVSAGQMYVVPAGVPHSVPAGSKGTLVIVEVPE